MTRTLILTRHAKSSWTDPLVDDFDRKLNGRGRKSATAIGAWLGAREMIPGEAIVSGARRTVDTWSGIAKVLNCEAPMRSEPAIYHAGAASMLAVLRGASAPVVMMIGHNPGIADFASQLVRTPPDHLRFEDYPTCATTVMTFNADSWTDIHPGTATVVDFVIPRELLD